MSKKKQKAEKIDPTEDFKLMIFLESSTITKDSVGDQIEESKYCPSEQSSIMGDNSSFFFGEVSTQAGQYFTIQRIYVIKIATVFNPIGCHFSGISHYFVPV